MGIGPANKNVASRAARWREARVDGRLVFRAVPGERSRLYRTLNGIIVQT